MERESRGKEEGRKEERGRSDEQGHHDEVSRRPFAVEVEPDVDR